MSNELDNRIFQLGRMTASIPALEGATFMLGLKKLADELAAPDTSGQVEGPFTVPLPDAISLITHMVSEEFKGQLFYTYYANMMRGVDRDGLADIFTEHAADELEHASYLLRRIGVLSPGGISVPPGEPPPPMTDPQQVIQLLIVEEQKAISLWKQLLAICGENPMKYTVEQFLQKEEEHQDELWQHVDPAQAAPMPTAETMAAPAAAPVAEAEAPKTASEILSAAVMRKHAGLAEPKLHIDLTKPEGLAPFGGPTQRMMEDASEAILHEHVMNNPHLYHPDAVAHSAKRYAEMHGQAAMQRKQASHALTAEEALAAGFDAKWAGKKERGAPSTSVSGWKGASALEKKAFMIIPLPAMPTEYGKAKAETTFEDMSPEQRAEALGDMRLQGGLGGGIAGGMFGGMGGMAAGTALGLGLGGAHSPGRMLAGSAGGALLGAGLGAGLGGAAGAAINGGRKDRAVESGTLPWGGHMQVLNHLNQQAADELRAAHAASKTAADLTSATRAQVADDNFVFPKTRKYPIHDEDHALAALGMVGMHGSPKEQSTVRAAVEKKYPGLQMQKQADLLKQSSEGAEVLPPGVRRTLTGAGLGATLGGVSGLASGVLAPMLGHRPSLSEVLTTAAELGGRGALIGGGLGLGAHGLISASEARARRMREAPLAVQQAAAAEEGLKQSAAVGHDAGFEEWLNKPLPPHTPEQQAHWDAMRAHAMGKTGPNPHVTSFLNSLSTSEDDNRKKVLFLRSLSGSKKEAGDRDEVIKSKARSLITAATENLRKMTDLLPKADQNRVEIISRPPESLLHEKAVFDTKKKDALTKVAVSPLELVMGAVPGAAGGFAGAGDGVGEQALGTLAGGGAGYLATRGMHHLLGKIPNSAVPAGASLPLSVLAAMSVPAASLAAGYGAGRGVRALAARLSPDATIQPVGEPISVTEKKSALGSLITKMAADIGIPAPGADSPESYMMREQQLAAQQAMAEAAHAKTVSMQSAQAAQQAQAEAQAATQQAQEAQGQLEQMQQQAQQASQMQIQAQQAASEAEARAAEHSISKMQLGMRVNQMRQELANLVMQDPVSEHAATVSDLAAQGQPATPQQQQQADMAAQQQEMAAQQGAAGGPPPAEAQKQQQEAQNAEQEAQVQEQQAQQAAPGGGAPPGGAAPPKTAAKLASIMDSAARRMGREAAAGAGEAVRDKAIDAAKKYGPAAAIAGAGTLALGAAHSSHARSQRKEDMTSAVAEGVRRAKTASPADRRLAREVFHGAHDTLGRELREVVTHGLPVEAAQAVANKAIHDVGHQVAAGGAGLLERARPHLPGAAVGLGAGIIGTKMMSGTPQPQQASPLTYAQYYGQ